MAMPYSYCNFKDCIFTDIDTGTEYKGIYTPHRVDRDTVPKGNYVYECRHGDVNTSRIVTVEPKVRVNFKGTFISETSIEFSNEQDKFINVERRWV